MEKYRLNIFRIDFPVHYRVKQVYLVTSLKFIHINKLTHDKYRRHSTTRGCPGSEKHSLCYSVGLSVDIGFGYQQENSIKHTPVER